MAVDDIPEFVSVSPGDLIRAEDWNRIQRESRNAVRIHTHTRPPGGPVDDTVDVDLGVQIGTNEIQDGAVAEAKIADDAVSAAKIPNGAVNTDKLANGAVTTDKIANDAVDSQKIGNEEVKFENLDFEQVNTGSVTLAAGASTLQTVQIGAPKSLVYFPTVAVTGQSGGTASIEAHMEYRAGVNAGVQNVFIRIRNNGTGQGTLSWRVTTFGTQS